MRVHWRREPPRTNDRSAGARIREQIAAALAHLGDQPEQQVADLARSFDRSELPPDFNIDELALELHDVVGAADSAVTAGALSAEAAAAAQQVGDALRAMSGPNDPELWTVDALRHSAEWRRIRQMAATALMLF